jgi:acetylornithine deacetylase/succinyl-diaminopimelate desuccinylase-like protein
MYPAIVGRSRRLHHSRRNPVVKVLAVLMLFAISTEAETARERAAKVISWRLKHEVEVLTSFRNLLLIPNASSDLFNLERNAQAIASLLKNRGIQSELFKIDNVAPLVYAEMNTPGANRTIGLYIHYDGQPVVASEWRTPPWSPALKRGVLAFSWASLHVPVGEDTRIYARSASDDKAPIVALVAALDAIQKERLSVHANYKFLFDGEEEKGSPHLPQFLKEHPAIAVADAWIILDGPMSPNNHPQISFGGRGIMNVRITTYGANHPLHSGHYGNWAPNPAARLVDLLSTLRDDDGRIRIPGFYDDVKSPTSAELNAIAQIPPSDDTLKQKLGLAQWEGQPQRIEVRVLWPALNILRLEAGPLGGAVPNAIPSEASADIDFRLVPDQKPESVIQLFESHVQSHGFFVTHDDPDDGTRVKYPNIVKLTWRGGYPAFRSSLNGPIAECVAGLLETTFGVVPFRVPSSGATSPMHLFKVSSSTEVFAVPIANYDNNQHAANENLRVGNLWDGITAVALILTEDWPSGLSASKLEITP